MQKQFNFTEMKKTLGCLLVMATMAHAGVIVGENGTLAAGGTGYVYTFDSGEWLYLPASSTSGAMQGPTANYYPAGAGDVLVTGYVYNPETGVFTYGSGTVCGDSFTSTNLEANHVYVGSSAVLDGGDFRASMLTLHLGKDAQLVFSTAIGIKHEMTVDYGDLTSSSAKLSTNQALWTDGLGAVTFAGSYTMSASLLNYELFSSTDIFDLKDNGLVNEFKVQDKDGELENRGVINNLDDLQAGQYALMYQGGKVSLVAKSIPEPAGVALSMMALAGVVSRRRRR